MHLLLSAFQCSFVRFPFPATSVHEKGPPAKKRRSKWDVQPDEGTQTTTSSNDTTAPTGTQEAPTSAAAAAAAKLNAKLASEGKLKPASLVYMVNV